MSSVSLADPLTLPCGATLPNRLAKAAMTEALAEGGRAGRALCVLYERWARGGAGLLLTGNVIIDRHHLERPGNVVLDGEPDAATRAGLQAWSAAAHAGGARIWMQLSHSGRQTPIRVNRHPGAPSAVALGLPGRQFGVPVALSEAEIESLIARFALAARVARECGFDGVQLHAAHGYLLSEFLNPRANLRNDRWGGPLANRARFLLAAVRAVRTAAGADFALSVKLNSADFQKGGFAFEDSLTVAGWLADAGVDLLELSGGSYEQPRMMNLAGLEAPEQPARASTRAREAYFLDFARAMLAARTPPLKVTGGFRTRAAMDEALALGVAVVGVGRPLCVTPEAPRAMLAGSLAAFERYEDRLRLGPGVLGPASPVAVLKALNGFATMSWYYQQLRRLGAGRDADPALGVLRAFVAEQRDDARLRRAPLAP